MKAGTMACSDFYVPTAGSTEFGVTQIQAFDLDAAADAPRAVAIVGAAETVYGNETSMVLAGRAYTDPWVYRQQTFTPGVATPNGVTPPPAPVETLNYTQLHLFDVASDPAQPAYVASGTVPGDVKDQFALDEKNGMVRVTTTEQRSGPPLANGNQNDVSDVFVLKNDGQGLSLFGDAGEIAPGEQLYSTCYVGDKAYVVTWHVTEHKAFTYFDDRKLLAFPYVRQPGYGTTPDMGPSSTLEVFHVDVASGIQKLGSVDHSSGRCRTATTDTAAGTSTAPVIG